MRSLTTDYGVAWIRTAEVIGAPLLFVAVYLIFCRLAGFKTNRFDDRYAGS